MIIYLSSNYRTRSIHYKFENIVDTQSNVFVKMLLLWSGEYIFYIKKSLLHLILNMSFELFSHSRSIVSFMVESLFESIYHPNRPTGSGTMKYELLKFLDFFDIFSVSCLLSGFYLACAMHVKPTVLYLFYYCKKMLQAAFFKFCQFLHIFLLLNVFGFLQINSQLHT